MSFGTSTGRFSPSRWIRNGHVQTLGASLPLWAPPRSFVGKDERLLVPVDDGSLVARAWWQDGDAPKTAVVLVHGVGGDVGSQYVVRAAVAVHRAGMHAVRLNLRGAGEGLTQAKSLYHAGLTGDIVRTIDLLLARPNVKDVAVVGFSLGGNVTLKLAGEWGSAPHAKLRAMVAVSPPLDLVSTSEWLEKRRTFPYRQYVLKKLVETGLQYARLYPDRARFDTRALARAKKIREYDELVVAPMHGFASANDYYEKMSSGPFLPKIQLRTLLVHAEDDPMIPPHTMRAGLADASKAVTVDWTRKGGHVGFFGSVTEDGFVQTYAMKRAIDFIAS